MDTTYRLLVTGSRYARMEAHGVFIEDKLAMARNKAHVLLMHGAAPGVDSICGQIARSFGWDVLEFPADWSKGKSAGPERNKTMVRAGADIVLAFPLAGADNRGTTHCGRFAQTQGLTVHWFELAALDRT